MSKATEKERVFVTGANGMLGSIMVRTLLDDGYRVTAMVYPRSKTDTIDDLPIRIVEGDITKSLPYDDYLGDCQRIIHVAASTQVWPRRDPKIWNINKEGTLKLVKAAKKANIKRFVHIGTASSFTPKHSVFPGNENVQAYEDGFGMDYMDSKADIQKALLKMHDEDGFPVIIVNPTFMIGPYDSGPTSGKLILNMMSGGIQAIGSGGKNIVYSGDVARAAVNALTMGRTGQCYIAGGQNLKFKELAQLVGDSLGIKSLAMKVPYPLTLAVGAILSGIARISGKAPKLSFTLARMSNINTYFKTSKAKDELNMPTTSLTFAIRSCAHWFIQNGYALTNEAFKDKIFVITGSTQGVGRTLAHSLIARGAQVVLNGRSESKASSVKAEFAYANDAAVYIPADVCEEAQCNELIELTRHQFGKIDYLINNAGMSSYGDLEDNSGEVIRQVFGSNLIGSAYLTKAALPQLKQNDGGVIFISSLAAVNGLGGHSIYSAAKAAMVSLAQSLKKELAETQVYVGYTCLGFTENDADKRTLNPQGELEPIPSRPGIKPMTQINAVNKILKQIDQRRHRAIHSLMGKSIYTISRISESLTNLILLKGYRAERAFLERINSNRKLV